MRSLAAGAAVLVWLALYGCTDREVTSVDRSRPPGQSTATLEVFLGPSDLPDTAWLDTTLVGFARPADATFVLLSQQADFRSRALFRFAFLPQRVLIRDTTRTAKLFSDGRILLRLDSLRSSTAAPGVVRLYDVEVPFDPRTADWRFAVDTPGGQVAWGEPGGRLGALIASVEFEPGVERDTVVIGPDTLVGVLAIELGAATDSLVRAWGDTVNPHAGLVLAVETAGDVRLELSTPTLRYSLHPDVTPDTVVSIGAVASARTFIFDPPLPDPGPRLAVAGLPTARSYLQISLPDSVAVAGVRRALRGSTINRAELWLTAERPGRPFATERPFTVGTFAVADDVRRFGAKTPVGAELVEGRARLDPDSLADGGRFTIGVTTLVQLWAATPSDSTPRPVRFALRTQPEPVAIGTWYFRGAGQPGAPLLRIVFTPRTEFELP